MKKYFSLVKISHTVFALPFALIGFTLAVVYEQKPFQWHLLLLMLLCMVFARNAAMAFNRYLDRKFDALNPRTAQREIPAGLISPRKALVFTMMNALLFILTTYFINPICFYFSLLALFVILFYSYTKRFTALCHLVLGLGLALAPIGAFLVVTGYFHWLPILFSLVVFTWTAGFDIIYALQDEDFDREHRLYSIPESLGKRNALRVSNVLHVLSALLIIAAGIAGQFNLLYWLGAAVFIALLIYQHLIVTPEDLSRVNLAFGNTNGLASLSFATLVILSLVL